MSIDITTLALAKEYTNRMVGSGGTGGGVNGKDGITPHIGDNGNWFIGTVDTGISAQGPAGENGVTPHIGTNGNWYIGSVNTGVSAKGAKGDNGVDGGHYTPVVTQPTTDTMQISFAPSKSDMPAVNPVTVNLPVSENSGQNVDLTGYATEQYVKEYAQPKGEYLTEETDPTVPSWAKASSKPSYTASEVGADPTGTAATAVSGHNTSIDAHGDIRQELAAINARLTAFFDSDNQTLDELSEIVAYITSNKSLIDAITTSKVSVGDIINNLATNVSNKPLSAAQGVAIKALIDGVSASLTNYQPKGDYALASDVPTKVSQLTNDRGYLTEHQDISGKLDADKLPQAVEDALAQAKASGDFDGEDGYTPVKGKDYKDGADGVSPTVAVSAITGGHRITITDKSGTKIVDVMDGEDGDPGDPGRGIKSIARTSGNGAAGTTDTYTITYTDDSTSTFQVKNGSQGIRGKSAYDSAKDGGYVGTEAEFEQKMAREVPVVTQEMGESESMVMSQVAVTNALRAVTALPYGGSKEWLENNGDKTQLYQIDGYVWGYIKSDGWTKSATQFLVVASESQMTNAGGTEYLLRNGNEGTVYSYTEASGDVGVPVYSTLPTTAKAGDIVAVGGKKYKASVTQQQVPNWTKNYADPSSADWGTDKRIGSDGTFRDCAGSIVTNFIPIATGDVVRVKGLDLANKVGSQNAQYMGVYKSDKSIISVSNLAGQTMYLSEITETTTGGQATLKSGTQVGYARFGGKPNSTANDIIVTINEEITYRTESTVTWTEVGAYTPPVEAGWGATDETYTVIDSLSATADSGDSAVYSIDGYVYNYIAGAGWASTSKYTPQGLNVDGELSNTSTNAVQNKVVAAWLDGIRETVSDNTNDIVTLQNKVESLNVGVSAVASIPSYWESMVAAKAETVKAIQEAGGKNCISFAWASDTHIDDNDNGRTNDIGKVMAAMLDRCDIPYALLSGDVNTRGSYGTEAGLLNAQAAMPVHLAPLWGTERLLMALGNHDGCWGDSSGYYRRQFSPERMWQIFFRGQALDSRRVFSDDGLYFYVDNTAQKTRLIVLNSHFGGEHAEDGNGWAVNNRFATSCYGQAQLDWLADVALDMPEGYGAVITAHVPPNITYTVDKAQLIGIVNAYNTKSTFSGSYAAGVDGWSNSTVSVDFTTAKGEIIAMFAGHVHGDSIDTTTMSCPIITILSAGAPANEPYKADAPTRTPGTATETSFDVVTINRKARTIYCTRVGAGDDREVGY